MNCRFKELRIRLGITQEEFRQDFNLRFNRNYTPSAISLFENNKRVPEISALIDFADYFAVSVDYLLHRDKPEGNPPGLEGFTKTELSHLNKYCALSPSGREIIDSTLDAVYRQENMQAKDRSYEKREIS